MKLALIKLHIAVLLVGFTGILGVLISLNEMLLVWYRIFITVFSLLVLLAFSRKLQLLPKNIVIKLFFFGAIIALHWVCFYGSIKLSNVSIGLVCFSATGIFASLLEPLIITKKIRWVEVLLGLLSLAGIYLIFHFDGRYQSGIIVGVISAALAALFSVLNKKNISIASPQLIMLYELSGGLLALTILMPLYLYLFPTKFLFPSLSDWGWLLVLSWICTIVAMKLMLEALQKVSAFTQNLCMNLEPVYAIILAFLIFQENEQLQASFYYGVGLILISVVLQMARIVVGKRH